MSQFTSYANKQKGMTLLVALVTLIVLMLLGLGAMQTSNVSFRLAGNLQFQNEAKNRAENALISAESLLMSGTTAQDSAFSTANSATQNKPYYDPSYISNPLTNWPSAASSVDATGGSQFIIQKISLEVICPPGDRCLAINQQASSADTKYNLYRVTAKGTTVRGASRLVESIVQIPVP